MNGVLVPTDFALPKLNIVQTAQATSSLSTLVTAVVTANVTGALSSDNFGLTVFAPTNDAVSGRCAGRGAA